MKIIFYCQYSWGMGHLVRSLEFTRALSDHNVTLMVGGQAVEMDPPDHVRLLRLPVLYMDEKFTRLISGEPGQSVEQVQQARKKALYELFKGIKPDFFIVELYPFGRSIFAFELEPLLERLQLSGKRLVFLAETLADLADRRDVEVVHVGRKVRVRRENELAEGGLPGPRPLLGRPPRASREGAPPGGGAGRRGGPPAAARFRPAWPCAPARARPAARPGVPVRCRFRCGSRSFVYHDVFHPESPQPHRFPR